MPHIFRHYRECIHRRLTQKRGSLSSFRGFHVKTLVPHYSIGINGTLQGNIYATAEMEYGLQFRSG
ncbi:hypothetical protein BKA67DRAFT_573227 [Truncatella angustata]|uniref:Uncharacterized protein n=1 Tax=Truncatella angustata TaxID=152316 RepID=A0A9P8ZVN4_9PEZI|nr:uncharacterized protein BKA67DRAFT_573227 [Truncatella angustata]KAH6652185.1 hypothetical protein BKA67DRAFT_573227 [Truncatella angustata]